MKDDLLNDALGVLDLVGDNPDAMRLVLKLVAAIAEAAPPRGNPYTVVLPDEPWAERWQRARDFWAWREAMTRDLEEAERRIGRLFVLAMSMTNDKDRAKVLADLEDDGRDLAAVAKVADETRRRYNEETRARRAREGKTSDSYNEDFVRVTDMWASGLSDPRARELVAGMVELAKGYAATS